MPFSDRRSFIKSSLGAVAGLGAFGSRLFAQAAPITSTRLADNLTLYNSGGANVLALTGADGVVMVDGGPAESSAALLQAVGGRITTLFNTHWHPEQTGSNIAVAKMGAAIVAHENTRLWLTTDVTRPWENKKYLPMAKEGRPTKTFYTTGSMSANGDEIAYGYMLQAHTDGDIYVFFPKANVLALGGLTSANAWPLIDWWTGGWIGGLPGGLETATRVMNRDTRVVPASGPVMTLAELETQTQMYRTISTRLQGLMRKGRSVDEALATEPAKEFVEKMGNPTTFLRRAFESCWGQLTPDA
jgi:glyoxylase-like metal-dependent hydrolase (beta-lactamase superfamily II)